MAHRKPGALLCLLTLSILMLVTFHVGARASPGPQLRLISPPDDAPSTALSDAVRSEEATAARASADAQIQASGGVIEVFTNTWSYSTIGMVYNPSRDRVRYAHESQSSTHNPTIYDRDRAAHTVPFSVALSTQNAGWPWQIDNRTGVGYDAVAGTYFLADYNGDLSYADDNIVEIDALGNILNAWEMDDEVSSNDSADGSEIDSIIDIAVVPGSPTRYFVTAAYDDAVVYEIVLTRTGALWTPNSWATVMTHTGAISETFGDNLGIDYDSENQRLYHSGWHTTTLLVTDLNLNPVQEISPTFDCPGAGGYNSGVTFIEGSMPPEVWVTDFSSDQTTRCAAPMGADAVVPGWEKWVADRPWDPHGSVITETNQVVTVTDVITALEAFTLTEQWDPDRLALVGLDLFPPAAQLITGTGSLQVVGPFGAPEVITVTKGFLVKPCNWETTLLEEALDVEGWALVKTRAVTITKHLPELHLDALYETGVLAGHVTTLTLVYSNTGGYETDAAITATFPITAPIVYAEPYPDHIAPDGTLAGWELGDLARSDRGEIDVYVFVDPDVPDASTVTIWGGIFNHLDVLQEEAWVRLHVGEASPPEWQKRVGDRPWRPGIAVTRQTSDTFVVQDVVTSTEPFVLFDEWNPTHLTRIDVSVSTGSTTPGPGLLTWNVLTPEPGPMTLTKEFQLKDGVWPETLLWEEILVSGAPAAYRPVVVRKQRPELWIDSAFDERVYSGDDVEFVLHYGNTGGRETACSIRTEFPPEASFIDSAPTPTAGTEGDPVVEWDIPEGLEQGDRDQITVTVRMGRGLPPSTTIEIGNGIFNRVDERADEALVRYHVPPPTWDKWVNGEPWHPDLGVTLETSDTVTVTDVISTRSAVAMVEHWDRERLSLVTYTKEPDIGFVQLDPGFLSWEFPHGAPGPITLTKWFHAEPCTWTYTFLWEELWVEDIQWERRPVTIDHIPDYYVYLPILMRNYAP